MPAARHDPVIFLSRHDPRLLIIWRYEKTVMKILVTGSSGHLGEGLVRVLSAKRYDAVGLDMLPGEFTDYIGSITDRSFVRECVDGISVVLHAATLHKPHVATHTMQDFIDVNISGTLNMLEEAVASRVKAFVFTSTTSAFGAALTPMDDAPAVWIDESVPSSPKNIYGATKIAAEDLCLLFHRKHGLNSIVLRTSRFFPEVDDSKKLREGYVGENAKANEFLFRRVDLEDAVGAHIAAMTRADRIGFGNYVISATAPFEQADLTALRINAADVVGQRVPEFHRIYEARGYSMFPSIDRVYVNSKARRELQWTPRIDFKYVLAQIANGDPIGSKLARQVGIKGYHKEVFEEGPYPVA